jgi:hypothetical protein
MTEQKFFVKIGYESWGGNEFVVENSIQAESAQQALEKLSNAVKQFNSCKTVVWGTCPTQQTSDTN